ncbi:DUF3455 domain-containing protein [Corallococcus praedator]|uniref:DUF3455 domain-containing protein n=1 Tax=Corallococcus praedator TaxID=2316724 RepID=A0ABX9QSW8_9BACT|nr:DUF3455 domain-containing protein [Corallococcus sp. CA031C]RKI17006.1 DUF3455 domain-containing protein [Corallococcus praedator]
MDGLPARKASFTVARFRGRPTLKPARTSPVRVIATLALAAVAFAGCDDDDDDGDDEFEAATEAVKQIAQNAPTSLPANVPDDVLRVTLGGVEYNLRELISRPSESRPSAHIVAAYQTGSTPADPPPFGTSDVAVLPDSTRAAPAAQVYECRQNGTSFAWTFLQPEAGLQPITPQPIPALELLVLDHFRYPAGIDYGPPTGAPPVGPAWRVSAPVLDQGSTTSGQTLFIGSVEATVANGPANVPLLRLANVARIDRGLPSEVFSRTTSDGIQKGYVLRLNTVGGIAPTTGCAGAPDVGSRQRVPYAADYYFIDVLTTP